MDSLECNLITLLLFCLFQVCLSEKVNQVTKFCSEPKSDTIFTAFCEMYQTEYNHQENPKVKSYIQKKYNIAYLKLLSSDVSVSDPRNLFIQELIKIFNPSRVALISDEFIQELNKDVMKKGIYVSFVPSSNMSSVEEERNEDSLTIISKFSSNQEKKLLMDRVSYLKRFFGS